MRIGIVSPYSLTFPGGVQGQVLGLARVLRSQGHEVRVLGPCDGPPPDPGVTSLGNSLPTAANGSMAPIAPDAPAQLRTIRALRDEGFEVVHLHEPLAPGPTMTAILCKTAPLVGTFHAAGGSLAYQWLRPAVRWVVQRLDVRCAVSEDARRMAERALGGTYRVVFNGIEVDRVQAVPPAPKQAPTIFFVGRHEPRKGLDVLLDGLGSLPRDCQVWVAGDGPDTELLRQRVADDPRVVWLGRITEEEKLARLRATDVFCAPSLRGESFGIVLLEAMAAGAAIVASDLPGYANVARPGRDALLVRPGDSAALAASVCEVLESAELRDRLVASGYERARHFSMQRLAAEYVTIYAEACAAFAAR